jgi:hypothetical protein
MRSLPVTAASLASFDRPLELREYSSGVARGGHFHADVTGLHLNRSNLGVAERLGELGEPERDALEDAEVDLFLGAAAAAQESQDVARHPATLFESVAQAA